MFKVFYSWQSDLPSSTNRNLILRALEQACETVRADGSIAVEPAVDRDTLNIPGAPNISDVIFAKIADADAFIADVSFINSQPGALGVLDEAIRSLRGGSRARATPNPNVLTELGFAIATLGHDALALTFNTYFGDPDALPFDLRQLRLLTYRAAPNDTSRAEVRKHLASRMVDAIKAIAEARRNDPLHDIIYPATQNVFGQAIGMFADLFNAAGADFDVDKVKREDLAVVCRSINPNAKAPLLIHPQPPTYGTWLDWLTHWRRRSREFTTQVMFFDAFLSREHVALLGLVEQSHYFSFVDKLGDIGRMSNDTLEVFESSLWKYLLAVRRLKHYTERVLSRRVGGI